MIDNFNTSAISIDNSFLSDDQQKTLDKLNDLIISINKNVFEQQIPAMVSLINTLPANEREPLFIHLATIKHGVIADKNIRNAIANRDNSDMVMQSLNWGHIGGAACAIWSFGCWLSWFNPITASVGKVIDGACAIVGLVVAGDAIVNN
jgi:hypothetical protein